MKTKSFFISAFLFVALNILAQELVTLPPNLLFKNNLHLFSFQKMEDEQFSINPTDQKYSSIPTDVIYDSVYFWGIDSIKKQGKLVNIEYNSNKLMMSSTYKELQNMNWVNVIKYEFTYDANNYEINFLIQVWNGSAWINEEQKISTYISGKVETIIQQQWNTGTAAWDNQGKIVYTYDNNGNKVTEEYQPWINNAFEHNLRFTTTYNSGNAPEVKIGQSYTNAVWKDVFRQLYAYDAQGNQLQILAQDKDTGNNWRNSAKLESTYDGSNKLLSETTSNWNILGAAWEELNKSSSYIWDLNNNLVAYKTEKFINSAYVLSSNYEAAYNSVSQLTDEAITKWETTGALNEKDSTHYFIHGGSNGINDVKPVKNSILIYPNPCNGTFTVSTENKHLIKTLEVYNVIGERILQQHLSNQVSIPNVQTGIYFVKIDDGTGVYTKKITVQ